MVVSSPAPFQSAANTKAPEPGPSPSVVPKPADNAEPRPAEPKPAVPGPNCNLRSRGMGSFPPRLARGPRPKNGPHSHVNLPPLPSLRGPSQPRAASPVPPLSSNTLRAEKDQEADVLTLEMRPARLHVSSLWHRLRFSGFSPMESQRRSTWKPGKPRRGRPEGTKGAGSRSL